MLNDLERKKKLGLALIQLIEVRDNMIEDVRPVIYSEIVGCIETIKLAIRNF